MHCLYFICDRKFYARTHIKITRHWKSTLKETNCVVHWTEIHPVDSVIHLLNNCGQATKDCTSFYKLRAPNTAPFHLRLQRPPDLTGTSKNCRGILTLHEWLIYRAGPPAIVASITASESILNMYTPRFYNNGKRKNWSVFPSQVSLRPTA